MKTRKCRKGGIPNWLRSTLRRMKEGIQYGYESLKGRATRMREGIKQAFQSLRGRTRKDSDPNRVPHIESSVLTQDIRPPHILTSQSAEAREITHLPVVNFTVNVSGVDGSIQEINFRRKNPIVYDLKHKVSLLLGYPFVTLHLTLNRSLCRNREPLIRDATYRINVRLPPEHPLDMGSLENIYNERSVHYSNYFPQTVPDGYIRIRMEVRGQQLYAIVKESDTIGYL